MRLLPDYPWQSYYNHTDGDLVTKVYEPALERAILYQRITGYFSGAALALAARGLNALIANGGCMQLVVGCTLTPEDVAQVSAGLQLRDILQARLLDALAIDLTSDDMRERLGWLAWMIACGTLDIKVAVGKNLDGTLAINDGLFHEKAGVFKDGAGHRIAFTGSINETEAGWRRNQENFALLCSWKDGSSEEAVRKIEMEFELLWTDSSEFVAVFDVPGAVRAKLLESKPQDPPQYPEHTSQQPAPIPIEHPAPPSPDAAVAVDTVERRRRAWQRIVDAPKDPVTGPMYCVQTCMIDPWPHQLRAYHRMLDQWPFKLLIADEVGLGKTIEAGLILRYLWLSGKARRILLMVPAGLLVQWQTELYEKFNLLVPIYDGARLVYPEYHFRENNLDRNVEVDEWARESFLLVSSHLMRRTERRAQLLNAEPWDLILLDEAHHARRKAAGSAQQKGANRMLSTMKALQDRGASLLLMTATPMQVHPVELYDLLSILGLPPMWDDQRFMEYFTLCAKYPSDQELHTLARMYQETEARYGPISEEEITRVQTATTMSKVQLSAVLAALRHPTSSVPIQRLSAAQRRAALVVLQRHNPVRALMSRHTRELLRTYAKRGLLRAPLAQRQVQDLPISMTAAERAVYDGVEDYLRDTWQAASADKRNAVGFVMTIYRRRMASSFHALRETLERRLNMRTQKTSSIGLLWMEEYDAPDLDRDEPLDADEARTLSEAALGFEQEHRLRDLIKQVRDLGPDSKVRQLTTSIRALFAGGYDSVIIFTEYTDTMDFLRSHLPQEFDAQIACYSGRGGEQRTSAGDWTKCTKDDIKRLLREKQIQILLCTDAAGEGLNLQHAGALINYDLPWNPMRVEQRIGRIDRIGQVHPFIRILNYAYRDTVEADVYFALGERINLFQGIVGKLQPILSRLPKTFESTLFIPKEERDHQRQLILNDLNMQVQQQEEHGFDIDAISDNDLTVPGLPNPEVTSHLMEEILDDQALLPPGVECAPLDAHTYKLSVPGHTHTARVTTSTQLFEEQSESHQLLLHDGPLFRFLAARVGPLP